MQIDDMGEIHEPEIVNGKPARNAKNDSKQFTVPAKYIPASHQGNSVAVKRLDFWFRSPDRWTGEAK